MSEILVDTGEFTIGNHTHSNEKVVILSDGSVTTEERDDENDRACDYQDNRWRYYSTFHEMRVFSDICQDN